MLLLLPNLSQKSRGLLCAAIALPLLLLICNSINNSIPCGDDGPCKARWQKEEEAKAREWIRREPNNADAHICLSQIRNAWYMDFKGQAEELTIASRLRPNAAEIHYDLGHALRGTKDFGVAAAEFHKAMKLAPTNKEYIASWECAKEELRDSKKPQKSSKNSD